MVDQKYKHAIIGCGRISKVHLDAFLKKGISEIILCDVDNRKIDELPNGDEFEFYDSYKNIPLNNLKSVSICTDHWEHIELANYFIKNDIAVLLEKPLSIPGEDITKFLSSITKKSIFTIATQHRYDPITIYVKQLLIDGKLGDIVMANFELTCFREDDYYEKSSWKGKKEKEGGSVIINQAYHLVDLINYFFGYTDKIRSHLESNYRNAIMETEETAHVLFSYPSFSVCLNATVCSSELWRTNIEIVGRLGWISFSIDEPLTFWGYSVNLKYDIENFLNSVNYQTNNLDYGYFGNSHKKLVSKFVDAVVNKTNDGLIPLVEIINTQKMVNHIYSENNNIDFI